jgi:hypothetical protein
VVLALDFANPTIAAVKTACEGRRLDGVQLCESNASVNAAMQNFGTACFGH